MLPTFSFLGKRPNYAASTPLRISVRSYVYSFLFSHDAYSRSCSTCLLRYSIRKDLTAMSRLFTLTQEVIDSVKDGLKQGLLRLYHVPFGAGKGARKRMNSQENATVLRNVCYTSCQLKLDVTTILNASRMIVAARNTSIVWKTKPESSAKAKMQVKS